MYHLWQKYIADSHYKDTFLDSSECHVYNDDSTPEDKITNDVLNKFYPILNSLGVNIYGKKSTNNRTFYSNIIEL